MRVEHGLDPALDLIGIADLEEAQPFGNGRRVGILGGERFIPSEHVQEIRPDRIQVDLSKAAMESLPEYEDAPVVRLEPERPGFFARLFGRR